MATPFYSVEDGELQSNFFGFSLSLPAGWRVSTARLSGGKAVLWLAPAVGHSDQLTVTLFPRDDAKVAKFFEDDELARRTFPGRASYPFGEAFTAPVFRRRLLFRANHVIVQVDEKEGSEEIVSGVEVVLQSLRFFPPRASAVPPELKAFRYLHPNVRKSHTATPAALINAELEARLVDHRSQEHFYDAAIISTVLGRVDQARALFLEASHQLEGIAFGREPTVLGAFASALEAALLSGDENRVTELALRTPAPSDRTDWTRDYVAYSRALGLLARGDDKSCTVEIRIMEAVPLGRAWMPGLGELVRCVVERDVDRYPAALADVLEGHHRRARAKSSAIWNSARSFLCAPATALAALGARRGLSIPDSLPHRRVTLSGLLAVCVQTTVDGPVLPGTTIELAVDYLPPALAGGLTRGPARSQQDG